MITIYNHFMKSIAISNYHLLLKLIRQFPNLEIRLAQATIISKLVKTIIPWLALDVDLLEHHIINLLVQEIHFIYVLMLKAGNCFHLSNLINIGFCNKCMHALYVQEVWLRLWRLGLWHSVNTLCDVDNKVSLLQQTAFLTNINSVIT